MSHPTKNSVFCPDCGRSKMLFQTEKEANLFIKFNGKDIDWHGRPLRVYYCPACMGYHISSHEATEENQHRTERLIDAYHASSPVRIKEAKKTEREKLRERLFVDVIISAPKNTLVGSGRKTFRKYLLEKFPDMDLNSVQEACNLRSSIKRCIISGVESRFPDENDFIKQLKTKWENE